MKRTFARGGLIAALLLAAAPAFAAPPAPSASAPPPSALLGVGILVSDMGRARAFYMGVLGMRQAFASGGPGEQREELGLSFSGDLRAGETMLLLVRAPAPIAPAGGVILRVADARAMIARLRAAGATIDADVKPLPGAPFLRGLARDPDGRLIELLQPLPQPAAATSR